MHKLLTVLLIVLAASPATAAEPEELVGLRVWNEIDKPIIETESGLKYKVLIMGEGRKPRPRNKITVHYRGFLFNGRTFDSSYDGDEPASFSLKRLVPGWIEGVQLMPTGSVFVFMIPPELAYGSRGGPSIPPDSTLIFEIELFGFK